MQNFIGISRCIVDHWIYQDAEYFKTWFEMLYRARWKEEDKQKLVEGQLVIIKRGYFIFGRQRWSERLGISEQRLRTLIKKLINENMIEVIEKHNKFTIYNIINYDKYNLQANQQENEINQSTNDSANLQNNLQSTYNQPTINLQLTTKEDSKDREELKYKYMSDSNEYRLADFLYRYMLKNNPNAKEPNFQKWSNDFNKILRIDKRDLEEVKEVIKFTQTDIFWSSNILSPDKLRKQYDQLVLKMKQSKVIKIKPTQEQQYQPKCKTVE